jgi:hypothetical protein
VAARFDALAPAPAIARRVAVELLKRPDRWLARRGVDPKVAVERLAPVIARFARGGFRAEALGRLMERALLGAPVEPLARSADGAALEARVREAARACAPLAGVPRERLMRHAMGLVMRELLGHADPADVRARLVAALAATPAEATR